MNLPLILYPLINHEVLLHNEDNTFGSFMCQFKALDIKGGKALLLFGITKIIFNIHIKLINIGKDDTTVSLEDGMLPVEVTTSFEKK